MTKILIKGLLSVLAPYVIKIELQSTFNKYKILEKQSPKICESYPKTCENA